MRSTTTGRPPLAKRAAHWPGCLTARHQATAFCAAGCATLARHDGAPLKDLTAPHTPGLSAVERRAQALGLERALRAQRLCLLQITGVLGEPQVGGGHLARQVERGLAVRPGTRPRVRTQWS